MSGPALARGWRSAGAGFPRPVEPRPERLDVGGVDRCAAPDSEAWRSVAVGADVVGRILAVEQLRDRFLSRLVCIQIGAIGELQTYRSVRAQCWVACEVLDPVRRLYPAVERGSIGVGARDQRFKAADAFRPVERKQPVLNAQHRRRIDRLALEDAVDQLA